MRVFIGRSSRLWVVEPKKGKVRKLPITLPGLIFWGCLLIVSGSYILNLFSASGYSPKVLVNSIITARSASEYDKKSDQLQALVARLQQEKDQANRLNMRLASKLENLEGAIGSVASEIIVDDSDSSQKNRKDKSHESDSKIKNNLSNSKFYKPISLGLDQRVTIKKVDRIIGQLRQLPSRFPVENPQINSRFGHRHSPHGIGSSFHRGIDLSLKHSDKVLSSGNGVVSKVGYMRGYGIYVDITHGKDIVTRYAHLSSAQVREAQKVVAGQLIARGGSTGAATGRHLHFEVIVKGRARDPMLFLNLPQKLQLVLRQVEKQAAIG
jgi:murein DD-endopeptidase MepM/ murein hydrolase activator NlpD